MTIPIELIYQGHDKEFQFRDAFIMPLLIRLGFGVVVNYHGQREFGRDVIFGDVDRFGHVIYYGMQIKYEASVSLSASHSLIQDAEQATHNPFRHPQTGKDEFISCFYVANAGSISDPARENFFNTAIRRGIRDARLLDGNALLLLDKAASMKRNADQREQLTGILQEVRRNRSVVTQLMPALQSFAADPSINPFPMQRCRNTAAGSYLSLPFMIPMLPIDMVDQYWEMARMINDIADSVGTPMASDTFRQGRADGLVTIVEQSIAHGRLIEAAVVGCLTKLSGAQ